MSWYQNPFSSEFRGSLNLGDRQFSQNFKVPANSGRGDEIVAVWTPAPYDLSGDDADGNANKNLTIMYAFDKPDFKNWAALTIDISSEATSISMVTVQNIIDALNTDSTFPTRFEACTNNFANGTLRNYIRQKNPVGDFRFYIQNGAAESILRFNARAGVSELPTYFDRHTIANRFNFTDSVNMLVNLTPTSSNIDAAIINTATDFKGTPLNYNLSNLTGGDFPIQADYLLMKGVNGIFTFKKCTIDGSNRVTSLIEYSAGAIPGNLAKKTTYSYSGANTAPSEIAEVPYTLQSGDLFTPP